MISEDIESLLESKGYGRLEGAEIVVNRQKIEFKAHEPKPAICIDKKNYIISPFIGSIVSCFGGELTPSGAVNMESLHDDIEKSIAEGPLAIAFFYWENIFIRKDLLAYSR
jgi:hypothetical protein